MAAKRSVFLPPQFTLHTGLFGNPIRQLARPAELVLNVATKPYTTRGIKGEGFIHEDGRQIIVLPRKASADTDSELLIVPTGKFVSNATDYAQLERKIRWLRPTTEKSVGSTKDSAARCKTANDSWATDFNLRAESEVNGKKIDGLRPPQIGAIHAVLAHWTVGHNPATIIMPTGTGKTETMLVLMTKEKLPKVLIVVPTDPLREQIATKCLTLGILRQFGIVSNTAIFPVVCVLRRKPTSADQIRTIWNCSNVIVTTMSIAGGLTSELLKVVAEQTSHLIIDEAHHVSAPSWSRCRDAFKDKPVLQFTATPFRNDSKHVDGKPIYNYPLRKAQAEGYFKPINFKPVTAYDRDEADSLIALAAIKQLDEDIAKGCDHLVVARAASIERAKGVHALYGKLASQYRPLIIHNQLKSHEKTQAIAALNARRSRIIVCVDMLGEGFDLPELKVAAMHDMHKSLAITLQFTGRFTRSKDKLGDATMIANIADANVEDSLQALYAEDSDWNLILRQLSENATGHQVKRSEFLSGFEGEAPDIAVQNVFPKMSTVVYRTTCRMWNPDRYAHAFKETELQRKPAINRKNKVLVVVTREIEKVPWGDVRDIQNTTWQLYLLHWDEKTKLLYINSSNNDEMHEDLATKVCGDDVALVRGEDVFRSLYGLKRILLSNLGLNHSLSRMVRFTWYVGSDIAQGLSESHLSNKTKSNLFGRGYEHGGMASIGCSRKGRIWSHKVAGDIQAWTEWCKALGEKLLNTKISFKESILPNVIQPKALETRPSLVPLTIEWSEAFLNGSEDAVRIRFPKEMSPLVDVGLDITTHDESGPIRFRLFTETESVEYEVRFSGSGDKVRVDYIAIGGETVTISMGTREKTVADWFQEEPPVIRFPNGASLIYNELCEVTSHNREPFGKTRIETRDWTGVNLQKESQTPKKLTDSIQFKMIQEAIASSSPSFDIILDDDSANEAADIVAIALKDDKLLVRFYHCKYSQAKAGARVKDLYEVCGQAQRSVFWKGDVIRLFDHLAKRDARQKLRHNVSRFEKGDAKALTKLRKRLPYLETEFQIYVVQPGLSRDKADDATLDLLASTELYLKETFGIPLTVIGSA